MGRCRRTTSALRDRPSTMDGIVILDAPALSMPWRPIPDGCLRIIRPGLPGRQASQGSAPLRRNYSAATITGDGSAGQASSRR